MSDRPDLSLSAVVGGGRHNGAREYDQHDFSLPVPTHAARLREALLAADFTADGLLDLLGAQAYAALSPAARPGPPCGPPAGTPR